MDNIDSIVLFDSGKGAEPAPAAPAPTGEAAQAATATPAEPVRQERDEQGKFKAKEAAQAEPEAQPAIQPAEPAAQLEPAKAERGQMSALLAERGKRQQAEQRAAELEARLQQLEGQGEALPDPEAQLKDRLRRELEPMKRSFLQQSVEHAAKSHEDFDEAIGHFIEIAENNPQLRQQWMAHEHPGEFAYLVGSSAPQFREKRERTYKEQITAKDAEITTLKARVTQLEGAQKTLSELPESLNRQPSGAQPSRQDDQYDINKIVRFK